MKMLSLVILILAVSPILSEVWSDENLLFWRKVGFPGNRISWVHLPDFYSQPRSESGIDLDSDGIIDLLVFLPEFSTDRVRAFLNDGSFLWEYRLDKGDQPSEQSNVKIAIYDIGGRLVKVLNMVEQSSEPRDAAPVKAAYWDGRNETGEDVAYGIYFYSVGRSYSLSKMLKLAD